MRDEEMCRSRRWRGRGSCGNERELKVVDGVVCTRRTSVSFYRGEGEGRTDDPGSTEGSEDAREYLCVNFLVFL